MRIISGTARGCALISPKNNARPTLDAVKESLFNIIAPNLRGATFLDLFAGSGAIGLEALSRGVSSAVFVDIDTATVTKNVEKTRLENATILKMNYSPALRYLSAQNQQFDFIFADPPYGFDFTPNLVTEVIPLLSTNGTFMLERGRDEPSFELPQKLVLRRTKIYSNCVIDFFGS